MKMYAEKREDGLFHHFYTSKMQMMVCGVDSPTKVEVLPLAEPQAGCYYAWREASGRLRHIYDTRWLVEMCSPDGFKFAISKKEGNIVAVSVTEVDDAK